METSTNNHFVHKLTLGDIYSDTVTVTAVAGIEVIDTNELFSLVYFPHRVFH
jgi:hypothetical protein